MAADGRSAIDGASTAVARAASKDPCEDRSGIASCAGVARCEAALPIGAPSANVAGAAIPWGDDQDRDVSVDAGEDCGDVIVVVPKSRPVPLAGEPADADPGARADPGAACAASLVK
ncbi:hypothetical protein CDL60_19560 [Roseateles noduli]|nr:hypothetical protein CDL60_19560 [Roseateles noduli]